MKMQTGDFINGFQVIRVREVEELEGTLYEMEHKKSGAQLVWLSNQDENKLFSVAFKTIPTDDTGVFHILEHSVLCGSQKYTAKEPFVELLKSSMNTFLNAMTFSDKTLYPISSRNQKDFENLMGVYLDAVFAPAIYQNPNIFYQEGWHYELSDQEAALEYKGVVLNEMKGVYSSVDEILESGIQSMLFPDNCYGYDSGGNPKNITDLTYEDFLTAHKVYYHPSNARIYLDGDLDIEATLFLIDDQYLSGFERENTEHIIPIQKDIASCETVQYYEISDEEEEDSKAQMVMGKVISNWQDRKKIMAAKIIGDYLAGSNDAPLKKALLSSGLVQDMYIYVNDGIQQPFVNLQLKNVDYENREKVKEVIKTTLTEASVNGLDKEELEAIINQFEFVLREGSEPKGLERNINALNAWLFGGDPLTYLTNNEIFAELREGVDQGYFDQIFSEIYVSQTNMSFFYALPSKDIGERNRKEEKEKLKQIKDAFSKEELEEVLAMNERLVRWQQTPDRKKDVDSLPVLELSDVDKAVKEKITEEMEVSGVKVLYHPTDVTGITYMTMYFNMGNVNNEMLCKLGMSAALFKELPTKKHSVLELQREIKKNIGALSFGPKVFSTPGNTEKCSVYLTVECSVLTEKLEEAAELIREILLETNWNAYDKIKEIFIQWDQMYQQSIIMNGHSFAMKRVTSHFSGESAVREQLEGFSCYQWLHNALQSKEDAIEAYGSELEAMMAQTITKEAMTLSLSSNNKSFNVSTLIKGYKSGGKVLTETDFAPEINRDSLNEIIQIPAGVSYAVTGMNLNALGETYSGTLRVLAKILSLSYLWNEVRVQGGAYGAGFSAVETGNAGYYSYRDPNPARSLNIYQQSAKFIREFVKSEEDINKFIIGSISDLEPLQSAKAYALACDNDYFRNISKADRELEKEQILSMTKEALEHFCDMLDRMSVQGARCIIGHAGVLEELTDKAYKKMSI